MIWSGAIVKIINEEFDRKIRRDNTNINKLYSQPLPKAMLIRFSLDHKNFEEDKEKYLEIMIFGQGYVTVLHRITDSRENYISGEKLNERLLKQLDWKKDCCHDSCWRYDGTDNIIKKHSYQDSEFDIIGIDDLFGWYSVINFDEKLYLHFMNVGK